MNHTLRIRNLVIGRGIPAIAAPVVGRDADSVLQQARAAVNADADLIEWRADYLRDCSIENLQAIAGRLRDATGETPLLFSMRTVSEGGRADLNDASYGAANLALAATRAADIMDVEAIGHPRAGALIIELHRLGALVLGSNHDFAATPSKHEIIRRLCAMQEMGCDLLKIAVMPATGSDVMTLMAAAQEMRERFARKPLIAISMGSLGAATRMMGEAFGSSVTFAAVGEASAPGQIPADHVRSAMAILHGAMRQRIIPTESDR